MPYINEALMLLESVSWLDQNELKHRSNEEWK
jgi:hypothetical protein